MVFFKSWKVLDLKNLFSLKWIKLWWNSILEGAVIRSLETKAHVYKVPERIYSAILTKIDFSEDKNSYYKLQLLESYAENPRR